MASDRAELAKQLNEALTELRLIFREESGKSMDVFLHEKINEYASKEMLGKILHDAQEYIHKHKRVL